MQGSEQRCDESAKSGQCSHPDVAAKERGATDEGLAEYRRLLVGAEQKAQEDFDKTVLTLSGGALAVSFAFVKDILGDGPIIHAGWLVAAWMQWALSVTSMLSSFYVSRLALRQTILDCDAEARGDECGTPGGKYLWPLRVLNACGAIFFVGGVLAMTVFVATNISQRQQKPGADMVAKVPLSMNLYVGTNRSEGDVKTMSEKNRPPSQTPKNPPPPGPQHANDHKPTRGYEPPPRPPRK